MVRNNKRRAFTIVELVIVIAVIAILAAVMIPTFGGIIKRANISADTQIAASMNTQLSIYKAEGKKIETEADLWAALKSDADFTSQLDPKSAKHGYHYWYDVEKNEIKLLANADVLNTETQAVLNADPEGNVTTPFAQAAPRLVKEGFYLLDKIADDKSSNDIAKFFDVIEKMGEKTKADYQQAITDLTALVGSKNNDNQALAQEILAKISKTAVMTDKGAFINTDNDENKEITFIYIPAAPAGATDYYLNHTVNHATDAEITDLLDLVNVAEGSVIEIPEGVKIAEGTLVPFGNIVVKVDVENDDVTNLSDVFAAGAVAKNAIVQIDGVSYTVNGNEVKAVGGTDVVETLTYLNPVTQFEAAADVEGNNIISITVQNQDGTTETNNYIALDKIKNVEDKIQLILNAKNFVGTPSVDTPVYEDVVWSEKTDVAGVSIDPVTGEVEFAIDPQTQKVTFNADTITFVATAKAVNEGTVTSEFTVKVLRLYSAQISFVSGENGATGTGTLTNKVGENGAFVPTASSKLSLSIKRNQDNAITTNATFAAPTNFVYAYQNSKVVLTDGTDNTENHYQKLGINRDEITATVTASNQTYFSLDENQKIVLNMEKFGYLMGGVATQYVDVTVSDGTTTFTGKVDFILNDNTDSPVDDTFPIYEQKVDANGKDTTYVYKVGSGSGSALPLDELFAKRADITGDLSNHYLFVFADTDIQDDGYLFVPIQKYPLDGLTSINFGEKDENGRIYSDNTVYWLMIGELEDFNGVIGVSTNGTVTNMVRVEVVAGENITAEMDVFKVVNGAVSKKTTTQSIVLHDNIVIAGESTDPALVLSANHELYGNYFTINAKKFKDTNGSNTGGYYMISMGANSKINQLILDGPTYPKFAIPNDGSEYFCFGILASGAGTQINDSYLFGFLSPLRVHSSNMVINNTTLEGGTWSNLWINSEGTITLKNVTTLQNHLTGYAPDFGTDEEKASRVLGMGIYVNDDLAGKNVTIDLDGVKQYNWIPETTDKNYGGNVDLARKIVFKEDENGNRVYDQLFFHPIGDIAYVNAAIVYQCLDVTEVQTEETYCVEDEDCWNPWCKHTKAKRWAKNDLLTGICGKIDSIAGVKKMPTINVDFTDNVVNGKKVAYNPSDFTDAEFKVEYNELSDSLKYAIDTKLNEKLSSLGSLAAGGLSAMNPRFGIDVFAASPLHDGSCTVCKEDFSKLSEVRANFTSVVTYADVDKLS